MIQTNELRIGNWVEYPLVGLAKIESGHDIDMCFDNAAQPVFLTEDILLKSGFKKNNNDYCIGDWDCGFQIHDHRDGTFHIINPSESQLYGPEIKTLHKLR